MNEFLICIILDIQELTIIIRTRHDLNEAILKHDRIDLSKMGPDAITAFRDQQKFNVFKIKLN